MTSLHHHILDNSLCDDKKISFEEKKIVLAYQDLEYMPLDITEKYANWVEVLDVSYNNFRDPQFLALFPNLTTLILDHNKLNSDSRFPGLPNLQTLWINNNDVTELGSFVSRLSRSAPNLRYLSMMKNPATPSSFGGESFAQYAMYRYFVIFYFPKLEYLDDQSVLTAERREASKHFKNLKLLQCLLPFTPKFPLDRENKIV